MGIFSSISHDRLSRVSYQQPHENERKNINYPACYDLFALVKVNVQRKMTPAFINFRVSLAFLMLMTIANVCERADFLVFLSFRPNCCCSEIISATFNYFNLWILLNDAVDLCVTRSGVVICQALIEAYQNDVLLYLCRSCAENVQRSLGFFKKVVNM